MSRAGLASRRHRGAHRRPARADPGHRRRDGHGDPAGPSVRGRLPRRAVRGLAQRPAGQQRPAHPDPARRSSPGSTASTSRPAPTSSRPTPSTPPRSRCPTTAWRSSPTSSTSRPRGWPARSPTRCQHPGPAAVRRRRARPDHPDGVDLARRQRPGRPQRQLRPAGRGVLRVHPRPARRRLGPALHRDDLRHPQRQGGDLRGRDGLRGVRPALAGHRLRHHHRRLRPHPVRPGDRGVLGLDPARQPDRGRPQLRARRQGDAALHRGDVTDRRLVRLLLPQRRAAQRVRRVRRGARGDRRDHRRVRRGRLREPGRRLLRHHARPHRRHRRRRRGQAAPRHPRARARHAAVRARAVHAHRGQPVRQRGRADQHHRLREVPEPDQGRRLRHRARRWPRSRSRTARRSSTSTWTRG